MSFFEEKTDYFNRHRKDHGGRAMMLTLALAASALIWAVIIAGVARLL